MQKIRYYPEPKTFHLRIVVPSILTLRIVVPSVLTLRIMVPGNVDLSKRPFPRF